VVTLPVVPVPVGVSSSSVVVGRARPLAAIVRFVLPLFSVNILCGLRLGRNVAFVGRFLFRPSFSFWSVFGLFVLTSSVIPLEVEQG